MAIPLIPSSPGAVQFKVIELDIGAEVVRSLIALGATVSPPPPLTVALVIFELEQPDVLQAATVYSCVPDGGLL